MKFTTALIAFAIPMITAVSGAEPTLKNLTSRATILLERLAEFEQSETFKSEVKIEAIRKVSEKVITAKRREVLKALAAEAKRAARDDDLDGAIAIKNAMSKLEDGVLELPAKTDSERIARELRRNWRPHCWVAPKWREHRWNVMTIEEVRDGVRVTNTSDIYSGAQIRLLRKLTLRDDFEVAMVMSGKHCGIRVAWGDGTDSSYGVSKRDVSTPTAFKIRCKDGKFSFFVGGLPATPSRYNFDPKEIDAFRVATGVDNRGHILIHDLTFERLKR